MTEAQLCPCTSGKPFAECCQPYIEGKIPAPSAEALMRSRYTAYTLADIDYLHDTLAPESRHDFSRESAEQWAKDSTWHGLDILETEAGQSGDEEGTVEFTAHFTMNGDKVAHHEKSSFRFDADDKRWYFVETLDDKKKPYVKPAEPGRNDPCPCGSGKKYKKCCAAAA